MLSVKQIEQFQKDGYLVVKNIFSDKELSLLQDAVDRVVESAHTKEQIEKHTQLETNKFGYSNSGLLPRHLYYNDGGKYIYHRSEGLWKISPVFQAITVNPKLLTILGQLIGHRFLPTIDSLVCKVPRYGRPVIWHQDPPYGGQEGDKFSVTHPIPNVISDIYINDSTLENGCLYGLPGEHLKGHYPIQDGNNHEYFIRELGAIPIEMEPGDINFHNPSFPHGSGPNNSNKIRSTFYIHWINKNLFKEYYNHFEYMHTDGLPGKYTDDGHEFIQEFFSSRKALGLKNYSDHSKINLNKNGFEYTGTPKFGMP